MEAEREKYFDQTAVRGVLDRMHLKVPVIFMVKEKKHRMHEKTADAKFTTE